MRFGTTGLALWLDVYAHVYSYFIRVYFVKHKDDALPQFKAFRLMVEIEFNKKIVILRSDGLGGGEYRSIEFKAYCDSTGGEGDLTMLLLLYVDDVHITVDHHVKIAAARILHDRHGTSSVLSWYGVHLVARRYYYHSTRVCYSAFS